MSGTQTPKPDADGYLRTRWWWIRHAPVVANGGRIYGQEDPPCDCSDRAKFAKLARILPKDAVWMASNLQRTHQTARAIWEAGYGAQAGLIQERDFAEQNLGAWQGVERDAFLKSRVGAANSYWLAPAEVRAPGGESFLDLYARVALAIDRHSAAHRGRSIVCVAHGGTIRAALSLALGHAPAGALGIAVENCSVTRLDFLEGARDSGWRVLMANHQPWLDGVSEAGGATA